VISTDSQAELRELTMNLNIVGPEESEGKKRGGGGQEEAGLVSKLVFKNVHGYRIKPESEGARGLCQLFKGRIKPNQASIGNLRQSPSRSGLRDSIEGRTEEPRLNTTKGSHVEAPPGQPQGTPDQREAATAFRGAQHGGRPLGGSTGGRQPNSSESPVIRASGRLAPCSLRESLTGNERPGRKSTRYFATLNSCRSCTYCRQGPPLSLHYS
jgi:hypothetical protein